MKKAIKRVFFCLCVTAVSAALFLIRDHAKLSDHLVRMHVVANSDSETDQKQKLMVRDAVLESIQKDLENLRNKDAALEYLQEALPKIQRIANDVLARIGSDDTVSVSVCKEAFPVRHYDTFSLPSGVYDTLRIVIGEGKGHNWWCVTFPSLCMEATSEGFLEQAAEAGVSDSLGKTLCQPSQYQIRFFLLDCFGKLENSFYDSPES